MGDRLTQLQDAVDQVFTFPLSQPKSPKLNPTSSQLANQFIATFYYIERHHDLETFGPNDKIPDLKDQPKEGKLKATLLYLTILALTLAPM